MNFSKGEVQEKDVEQGQEKKKLYSLNSNIQSIVHHYKTGRFVSL